MNYRVRVRCVVTKSVYCEDCTEEQARTDPFGHATDEQEMDQEDWKVLEVEEDEP
jgi:hypothetical protein